MLSLNRRPDDPITLAANFRESAMSGRWAATAPLAPINIDSVDGPTLLAQPFTASFGAGALASALASPGLEVLSGPPSVAGAAETAYLAGLAAGRSAIAGQILPAVGAGPGGAIKPSAGLSLATAAEQAAAPLPAATPITPQVVINQAALATTQPQLIDFTGSNLPVFGAKASFSFSLPSFLYQSFGVHTGVSFAGFGVQANLSASGGVKGGVTLSAGNFSPDFPVNIDPGVTPFVQDGQVFSVDPSLISTTDAQFALSLPQANANLDFGLQANAGLTFSFPGIPIGVSLPFVGFVGYTIHIPSQTVGFKAGSVFHLPSNTTFKIPGDGSVTLSELQASVVNSDPQSAYEGLPTLEMAGDTAPFFSANIDLVSLLAEKVPDPFAFLAGSKSFDGVASLSYKLFSLVLSTNLWLHEDVKISPVKVIETVTDTLTGQSQTGVLGQSFNFTAPSSGDGIIPLKITFGLVMAVQTELDLDGNIELTAEGPSVSASVVGISKTIGPLGNYNLFNESGKLFQLYNHTSYETLTATAMVDLQNFSTAVNKTISGQSGAVSITQPATNLVVGTAGTVKGAAFGVTTGTLSAAMVNNSGLITASGNGVQLQAGGSVEVQTGGRILGIGAATGAGVLAMANPVDAVINYGIISGFNHGVDLLGGSVKNDTGAVISAAAVGVEVTNAGASIVNNGLISGSTGVSLINGGGVYNAKSGTITGGVYGVYAQGVVAVENHCTLTGGSDGVRGQAGGAVMNLTGAYIHGGAVGVLLIGAGEAALGNAAGATISGGKIGASLRGLNTTLVDYGTISGSLDAVQLYGSASNTLVLDPAAKLNGALRMSAVVNTISLTGAYGGVGSLVDPVGAFAFAAAIDISPGAAWNISGDLDDLIISGLNPTDTLTYSTLAYAAGDRIELNRRTNALNIFAAGAPTNPIGTIQLAGTLTGAPHLSAGAGGALEISFSSEKLSAVTLNNGEVDITSDSLFGSKVTVAAGVTVSADYYGVQAQSHGVYSNGVRATLINYGTILASTQSAVYFASGGVVTNEAGALIQGPTGLSLGSNSIDKTDTVTFANAGTVMAQEGVVYLNVSGTVTNLASGQLLSTFLNGVQLNAIGEVINDGTIIGGRHAARLFAGGFVYNDAGGLMVGHQGGVDISGGIGTVVNCGTILATASGPGVYLRNGGVLLNETGDIAGVTTGVEVSGADGSIGNAAHIEGILLNAGGMVVNGATGTIDGTGIVAGAGGAVTVINAGLISGSGGVAVQFASASDRLILKAGASFGGAIQGGGGTLELTGGTGKISGLGGTGQLSGAETASFSGFGSYLIDAGAAWSLSGAETLAAGQTVSVGGALTVSGVLTSAGVISGLKGSTVILRGADLIGGSLVSAGAVTATGVGNTLDGTKGVLTSQAALTVANGVALTLQGSIANKGTISLAGRTLATRLMVGAANATLSGGGSVVLGASAFNSIVGATSTALLVNLNDTIRGSGAIGGGKMKLFNGAAGTIEQTGSLTLTINTGINRITNNGLIESAGTGGLTIASAVLDNGTLQALAGTLTLAGQVSGAGRAVVAGGRLVFKAADTFKGGATIKGGFLELAAVNAAGSGAITFAPTAGAAATLVLDAAATTFTAGVATFANPLVNFGVGGFIDITGMTYAAGATVSLTGNVMTVSSGGEQARFTLAGALPSKLLVVANAGGGVQINTEGLSTQFELAAAIDAANQTAAGAGAIKLLICGDIDLTKALAPIDLAPGVTLDFQGSGLTAGGAAANLTIDGGSVTMEDWTFDGPLSLASGADFSGNGVIGGAVSNNGRIEAVGGSLTLAGDVTGGGDMVVGRGATLVLGGGDGQTIDFTPGGGRLTLDDPAKVTGLIRGFGTGDVIDLAGLTATRLRRDGALVSVYDGTRRLAVLDIAQTAGREIFSLASDGAGGTQITAAPWTQTGPTPIGPITLTGGATGPGASLSLIQSAAGQLVGAGTAGGASHLADDRAYRPPILAHA